MRYLLDTHVVLWALENPSRLSERVEALLRDGSSELVWSIASSWEIAVKIQLGKLEIAQPLHRFFAELVSDFGVELLAINHSHCGIVASLPLHHRDPFDRMLIAQAQHEQLEVVSIDRKLHNYDVKVVW